MDRLMKRCWGLALAAVYLSVPGAVGGEEKTDLTGTWEVQIEIGGMQGAPEFTFKQEGDKLTGKYKGQLGEADVTGKVKGNKVEFSFMAEGGKIVYTGTIDKDAMKGEANYLDQATGTWTAKKKPAPPPPARGQRTPTPNDSLVSPEFHPDRRVTFRLYAPKASEVNLRGEWMGEPGPVKLEKNEQGVWSATVGPLVPDLYSYSFNVDGVKTLDPKNATIKQGVSSLDNLFFLAGPEAAFQENRKVPHGEIRQVWYPSTTLDAQRRMHIYMPPGYDQGQDRYPVLYLLHGGGDEDSGWSTVGRAGFILDNLLAEKKTKPMLVVMPNGSLRRPANLPRAAPGAPATPEVAAARAADQDRFTNELLKDIVPFVEKNYRVIAARENRALAGLSMGGGQTLRVVATNPDQFAYVAVWSAGIGRQNAAEFEKRNPAFLDNADRVNHMVKLFSIRVGDKDFAFAGSQSLSELLNKRGIKNELGVSGGGHTWINWRHYLHELAPRLFRDEK